MFIGLALSAVAAAAPAEDGLILPQPATLPMVSGSGLEGGTLSADTGDSWTHDGAPASVTARSYRLLLDGAPAVTAQPSPDVVLPSGTGGAAYLMQLRVQVAEAPGLWSSWVTVASGIVAALPRLSGVSAATSGPDGCIAEVSTDTGSGTLYWDVTEEATPPAALKTAWSQPVTEAGLQTVTATGLTAGTTYYVHFVQSDGAGHDSAPVSSQAFTTELAAQVPAPFGPQDWSIADAGTGGDAILTIAALPFAGAAALSGIDWRIGSGAWTPLGAVATGTYPLTDGFTDGVPAEITLRAVNIIGPATSSDTKTVTTSAAPPDTITIGTASYTPGGGGSGPVLALGDVDPTGTTGPYTVFLATHSGGTTLAKSQIEAGTGEALDAVSFTDDDGAVAGQALTLSTSLTGGRLSVFLRDALGAESAVTTLDGVDVDATAPVVSGIAVSNIAATSADWEAFTDEAGGAIHVRARASGAPQWTAAEIIAAPDGSVAGSVLASTAPALYGGATEPGLIALWDAGDVPDGPVAALPDLAGPFELAAVAAPTASGGVITFDGVDDVMIGAVVADTGAQVPGARHLRDYALPDASGGDPGQGFSIAGLAHDDADGTWWAVNGGLNLDGSQADRQQSLVHLSADFSTVLAEIDLDAVMPELETNDESPQAVAVDNANGYLWVGDPAARAIRCFDKATAARIPANDISRGYDIGSLAIAEDGTALWVMSRNVGDATIQKISTDGTATVSVDFTIDLDNRHDHLTEKDGLLYVSCGTNGAQAFVVAVDPVQGIALGRAMLPYPGNAEGMVGIEGIQFGAGGSVFIAHNGHFHYGDPGNPVAPLQWPRTNIVAEYTLPPLGGADLDLFALVDATPGGADCALQFGSALDAVKTLPAVGLFLNGALPAIQLRKNHAGGGDVASLTHSFDGPVLIYIAVRGATVTFHVNGVEAGTDTLGPDGLGAWGPVHPPELGGAHTNANRHTPMGFYAGGLVLGANADRQVIEGALAHRHGLQSLLPAAHPFKSTAP
jgi:hypothetical protein